MTFTWFERQAKPRPLRVCLVTNELYPFASGGIGRLMSNWVKMNSAAENGVQLSLLFPREHLRNAPAIRAYCQPFHVTCYFCEEGDFTEARIGAELALLDDQQWDFARATLPPFRYYLALQRLIRDEVEFDVIEFPDYGGWAWATIEAKRAGLAFAQAKICVRLHSTYGIIVESEPFFHNPSGYGACVADMERLSLKYADLVVGHLPAIAHYNRAFYGFSDQWLQQCVIETPPITVDEFEVGHETHRVDRVVFSSRLQPFKRPDLFLQAACRYCAIYPEDGLTFVVASYGWDGDYIERLRRIVPDHLSGRILFHFSLSAEERQTVLDGSILVIPSDYESYCLLAYEAGVAKRRLLLREDCVAFGDGTGWVDGENCLKFSDDPDTLARVIHHARSWSPKAHRTTKPSEPYWFGLKPPDALPKPSPASTHLVLYGAPSLAGLAAFVRSCKKLGVAVSCVVPRSLVQRFEHEHGDSVAIIESSFGSPSFGEVWRVAARLSEDVVVFARFDDDVQPMFFRVVAHAFAHRPELNILSGHTVVVDEMSGEVQRLEFSAGEQVISGASGQRSCSSTFAARRTVIQRVDYEERDGIFGLQSLIRGIADRFGEVAIAPEVYVTSAVSDHLRNDPRWIASPIAARPVIGSLEKLGVELSQKRSDVGAIRSTKILWDDSVPFQRIAPAAPVAWGDPINYNGDHHALLVHPSDTGLTIARVSVPESLRAADLYFAQVDNIHSENSGFEFALIIGSAVVNPEGILGQIEHLIDSSSRAEVMPLDSKTVFVMNENRADQNCLYFVTRVEKGRSASHCQAMVKSFGAGWKS